MDVLSSKQSDRNSSLNQHEVVTVLRIGPERLGVGFLQTLPSLWLMRFWPERWETAFNGTGDYPVAGMENGFMMFHVSRVACY